MVADCTPRASSRIINLNPSNEGLTTSDKLLVAACTPRAPSRDFKSWGGSRQMEGLATSDKWQRAKSSG